MTDNTEDQNSTPEEEKQESSHQVELDKSPIKDVYGSEKSREIDARELSERFLSLLNLDMSGLDEISDSYPKMDSFKTEESKAWAASYLAGLEHLLKGNALSDSVQRADATWRQKVDNDGEKLGARKPLMKNTGEGRISGDRAIAKIKERTRTGGVVQVPLWHSGIWLTIKSPSEGELLELDRRISNEKIQLGRTTSGMIFSNTSIYSTSYIINFILNHVHDASVADFGIDNLKEIIKVTDIPTLVWGIACSMYPSGYEYARPCTSDPTQCQHVVKGVLDLPKLFWTDNFSLSGYQKKHMARRGEKVSKEDLKRYEEEHVRGGTHTFELNSADPITQEEFETDITVKLKVPNINQYETSGFTWVDSINKLTEGSLGISLTAKEREDYILDQARLTTLRQYGHWVGEMSIDGEVLDDIQTIEDALDELCKVENIQDYFFDKVGKFIDDSTISLIAIPKYDCPVCGGEQQADVHHNKHPHLLPIDTVSTFFTLLDQQVFKALVSRKL